MAGKGQSLLDADGVGGRKNKLVFTGKRPACGDTHAQELTAAIHFQQFTRATEELLVKGGAKPRFPEAPPHPRPDGWPPGATRKWRHHRGHPRAILWPRIWPCRQESLHAINWFAR